MKSKIPYGRQNIDDKDIDVVLQKKSLVIGKVKLDITEEVIKIINLEVKEYKIK